LGCHRLLRREMGLDFCAECKVVDKITEGTSFATKMKEPGSRVNYEASLAHKYKSVHGQFHLFHFSSYLYHHCLQSYTLKRSGLTVDTLGYVGTSIRQAFVQFQADNYWRT
jgi:hypothetical protein